jgi:hypothetical protein
MSDVVLSKFVHEKIGSRSRVTSNLDGVDFWFESEDLDLEPVMEALGTLWLIPCLLSNRNLRIEQPVCKVWYENAHAAMQFLKDNWGTANISIIAETREALRPAQDATAVFFSGGVDSFYSATQDATYNYLVNVENFDAPATATSFAQAARNRVIQVAKAVGSIPVTVRTNINEHPSFQIHKFADTHGAILAAIGHLLTPHIGSIKISPSLHSANTPVFGSNYRLDPLWSSKSLQIFNGDPTISRQARISSIADLKVVQENLRVCVRSSSADRNCSRCEKCIRTMLDLHLVGKLEQFKIFDQSIPIWEAMDLVSRVSITGHYYRVLEEGVEPQLEHAIQRMLRRNYVRNWKLEDEANNKRHIDEEFPKLKEGLENALHHYSLLQENYDNLARDFQEVSDNSPLRRGVRAIRHVMRLLRSSDKVRPSANNNNNKP